MAVSKYKSPLELFRESSQAVMRNLSLFVLFYTLAALDVAWRIGLSLRNKPPADSWHNVFTGTIFGSGGAYPHIGGGALVFLLAVLTVISALLGTILAFRVANHKTVELPQVWEEFKAKGLRLLGVQILTGLIIILGLFALIIPGIYLLGRLALAPYVLLDKNSRIQEALKGSWQLTQDRWTAVLIVLICGLVLSLPSLIPVAGPVIALILTVLYAVALPLRYFEFKGKK